MDPAPTDHRSMIWAGALFEGGLALLAGVLAWGLGISLVAQLRWDLWDALIGVAGTAPMLAAFFVCLRWPVGPLARIKQFCDEVIRSMFAGCSVGDLAILSLLAGLGEELLFRGVLQEAFARWLGPWTGLVLASLLFGLMHPITPAYVILAGVIGAYLGVIWMATGNLLVVIIAHALYDFIALLILLRRSRPLLREEKEPADERR